MDVDATLIFTEVSVPIQIPVLTTILNELHVFVTSVVRSVPQLHCECMS